MSTSTEHTVKGKFNEIAGKVKQSVGEATGNDSLANKGAAQQVKGHAEQAWGAVKGAAEDKAAELKAEHNLHAAQREAHHEDHAHDLREKITTAAEKAKEHIQHAVSGDHR
jgi:uncharacterized protein YjbJ (UPF0337 family)